MLRRYIKELLLAEVNLKMSLKENGEYIHQFRGCNERFRKWDYRNGSCLGGGERTNLSKSEGCIRMQYEIAHIQQGQFSKSKKYVFVLWIQRLIFIFVFKFFFTFHLSPNEHGNMVGRKKTQQMA